MIRHLGVEDVDVYRAIRLEALRTDPDAFGESLVSFEERSVEELEYMFEEYVASDHRWILIDELDGVPRGMCGCGIREVDSVAGFIWGMFVTSAARRQGIGAGLVKEALRFLASCGAKKIEAKVAKPNGGAIQFYRRLGFKIGERVGTLREGSEVPVYRIEMEIEGNLT